MDFRYFQIEDFDCQETGENRMDAGFIEKLDELRETCGFPFVVTSGYRSPRHSLEIKKKAPGSHTKGYACDIATSNGMQRLAIVKHALAAGFTGIGIHRSFVHVDTRDSEPVMWVY
jgi:zinc D-Ala-D-Ala carboxypeptidase